MTHLPTVSSALATLQLCLWTASRFSHSSRLTATISCEVTVDQTATRWALGRHHSFYHSKHLGGEDNHFLILKMRTLRGSEKWSNLFKVMLPAGREQVSASSVSTYGKGEATRAVAKGTQEQRSKAHNPAHSPRPTTNLPVDGGSPLLPNYFIGFLWGTNEIPYVKSLENSKALTNNTYY